MFNTCRRQIVPLRMAFGIEVDPTIAIFWFEAVIDATFIVDIFLNFSTGDPNTLPPSPTQNPDPLDGRHHSLLHGHIFAAGDW